MVTFEKIQPAIELDVVSVVVIPFCQEELVGAKQSICVPIRSKNELKFRVPSE